MTETKPDYYIVSFSGGKDSTAMLLRLMETGAPIDEVLHCDTGLEFPDMYDHIERIKARVQEKGIKYTTLKSNLDFEYLLLEKPIKSKKDTIVIGYGWPTPRKRWCTQLLKTKLLDAYKKELKQKYNVFYYVGRASDEEYRLKRKNNQSPNQIHPLVYWGWKESDCLEYCYSLGYDWNGLYKIMSRVSCWCCPLQSFNELYQLWLNFPVLWDKLRYWSDEIDRIWGKDKYTYRKGYSITDLEARFKIRLERETQKKSISNATFYKEVNLARFGLIESQTTLKTYEVD